MRYLLIFAILTNLFSATLLDKLDNLIKTKREKSVVVLGYDPFKIDTILPDIQTPTKADVKKTKKVYKLSAVINNRAFINGRWYQKNDKIDSFIVKQIGKNIAVLSAKKKRLTLKLENKRIIKVRNR